MLQYQDYPQKHHLNMSYLLLWLPIYLPAARYYQTYGWSLHFFLQERIYFVFRKISTCLEVFINARSY